MVNFTDHYHQDGHRLSTLQHDGQSASGHMPYCGIQSSQPGLQCHTGHSGGRPLQHSHQGPPKRSRSQKPPIRAMSAAVTQPHQAIEMSSHQPDYHQHQDQGGSQSTGQLTYSMFICTIASGDHVPPIKTYS